MQTGDITKQWTLENYGKFNRGVGGFHTEDERKAMENGMWYLLADCEIADVLCVVI